jgi:hypothetical protein
MIGSSSSPTTTLHLATSTSGGLPSFIIQDNARSGSSALNYLMLTDSLNATQAKIGFLSGLNTEFTLQNLVGNLSIVSNNQMNINSGSDTVFLSSSSEKMRLTSGGNLLIGVTSGSTARLQSIAANGNSSSLRIGRADNSNFWEFNHAGNDLRIYNEATSGSNILLGVDAGGNVEANKVGIGTATPTGKLHVVSSDETVATFERNAGSGFAVLKINSNVAGDTGNGAIRFADTSASSGEINYEHANDSMRFHTSGSEKMRLTSNGNLLINRTSDAGSRVQVDGEIRIYNANFDINSDGYGYRFGAGDCGIFHTGYNMTFKNYNGSSLVENMRLTSDGYLGINNSSPATNLHVGTGSGGSIDSSYQIGVDGSAISGIQILSGSSQSGRIVFGDSNNTSIGMLRYEHSDNSMRFRVNGSERARITSGGNLLIGVTSGFGITHAYDYASGIVGITVQNGYEATNNGAAVYFKVAGSTSDYRKGGLIFVNNGTGYGRGDMYISLNTSTSSSAIADISSAKMIVRDTGKLNLPAYGSGSFTGTETYFLAVTSGGDVVEADSSALPGGPYLPLSGGTLTGSLTGTTATFVGDGDIITAQRGTFTVKTSLTSVNHNILSTGKAFNFGTTDSQGIFFMTNNSVGMNLDSSGRLLINTTSTAFSDKLYVNGDAYTTGGWRVGSGATFVGKMFNSSGKFTIQSDSNRDLQFGDSNNAGIMYIDTSTQQIGIGTTSPSANLEIKSTGDTNVIIRTDGDASDVPSLELRRGTTSAYSKIHYEADGGSNAGLHLTDFRGDANSHIIFNTQGDNERMRIESNGNILVNTTTDSGAKLYVNGVIRAVGGGIQAAQDYGFTLNDESGSNRYGLKFGAAGTVGGSWWL